MPTITHKAKSSTKDTGQSGLRKIPERTIVVVVRLSREINHAVNVAAAQRELTKRQLMEDALRSYLGMDETTQPAAL